MAEPAEPRHLAAAAERLHGSCTPPEPACFVAPPDFDRRRAPREGTGLSWREWLEQHARLAGTLASIGMAVGALVASLGFKIYGPGARVEQVSARVDSVASRLAGRVDSVAIRQAVTERREDRAEARLEFLVYLNCVVVRQVNPIATPPDCAPIIQSRGAP